jgi:hypothetical protein
LGARVAPRGAGLGGVAPFWPILDVMVRTNTLRRPAYHTADEVEAMGLVRVQIWDATATKRQEVEMPDDAPVNRILAVLLEKMNFPQYAPDGQPLSYKFHHRASGKQLLDTQTLREVGVKSGDVLRLQPEITAG